MQLIAILWIVALLSLSQCALVLHGQDADTQARSLGLKNGPANAPIANYVNVVRVGNMLYLSGKGPMQNDGTYITGKVGSEITIETGYHAARLTALSHLTVLKAELGSLNKVKRIVKVFGMVNCVDGFTDHPNVINGYSDLMVKVFGENGKHARSAIGVCSLPLNMTVEVELIVELQD